MVRKLAVSRLVRGKVAQAVSFRGGFAFVAGVAMFCVCVFSHFPAFFDIAEDPSKNSRKSLIFLFISWRHYMTPFFARLQNLTFLHFQ